MASPEEYQQQIEAGKAAVKEVLVRLATELAKPEIGNLEFFRTAKDFDNNQESLWDPVNRKSVAKLNESDLADMPATPTLRKTIETQVRTAVTSYYKPTS